MKPGPKRCSVEERFFQFVNKTKTCWLWTGSTKYYGYGQFSFKQKPCAAHRWSYLFHYGVDPGPLEVCHRCDVPACVNPEHLFLGDRDANMGDAVSKRRMKHAENHYRARLSNKQVIRLRDAYRNGTLVNELADEFGIPPASVSNIAIGKSYRHLPGVCAPHGHGGIKQLTDEQVIALRRDFSSGMRLYKIAPKFGVSQSYASCIATGKYFPDVPGVCAPRKTFKPRRTKAA